MRFRNIFDKTTYKKRMLNWIAKTEPSFRSVLLIEPGHFYSPLLDLSPSSEVSKFDGEDLWDGIRLDVLTIRESYRELISILPCPNFSSQKSHECYYYSENKMFAWADAFTLSAMIRCFCPKRIVEVGSGFSTAVMLDTCDEVQLKPQITLIEPYPDRLKLLLKGSLPSHASLLETGVQQVDLSVFDALQPNDICFIDSSHVAKIGSDVTWIILKLLPRLKAGVVIHVHDVFYPHSYPLAWVNEGRACNESIFLRAYLTGQSNVEVLAFNSYAAVTCSDVFPEHIRVKFCTDGGGSFWFRHNA